MRSRVEFLAGKCAASQRVAGMRSRTDKPQSADDIQAVLVGFNFHFQSSN